MTSELRPTPNHPGTRGWFGSEIIRFTCYRSASHCRNAAQNNRQRCCFHHFCTFAVTRPRFTHTWAATSCVSGDGSLSSSRADSHWEPTEKKLALLLWTRVIYRNVTEWRGKVKFLLILFVLDILYNFCRFGLFGLNETPEEISWTLHERKWTQCFLRPAGSLPCSL